MRARPTQKQRGAEHRQEACCSGAPLRLVLSVALGLLLSAAGASAPSELGLLDALGPSAAAAQDARSDYLIGLLRDSDMFRVRTQAAISLGRVQASTPVIQALGRALRDEHPSVRAAAANSLGRLGHPNALAVLRAAPPDSEASVRSAIETAIAALSNIQGSGPRTTPMPNGGNSTTEEPPPPSGPARYYVGVGLPGSRVDGVDRQVLQHVREFLRQRVGSIDGVRLAPDNERQRAAERVMRDDSLEGYFIDSAVVSLTERPGGALRAQVSVVLQSYPDRNIRSTLSGAATVTGGGAAAQQQAIEHAFLGALRSLPRVMEATTGGIVRGGGRRGRR